MAAGEMLMWRSLRKGLCVHHPFPVVTACAPARIQN